MTAYVVKIGRLFVGHTRAPEAARNTSGWRSVVWTKGLIDAEKFSSADEAKLWAKTWLLHDDFVVTGVPVVVPGGVA